MERYCVIERNMRENHAGAKAREDVSGILLGDGWIPFQVHHSEQKGLLDKLKMVLLTHGDWKRIYKQIPWRADLLLQYPLAMYPKVSLAAIPYLKKLKKKKVRRIFLIHDLDSLRGGDGGREGRFLREADVIIAHNARMAAYLKRAGYSDKKIISLDIFDYIWEGKRAKEEPENHWKSVAIAGNLKREKAGYAYLLDQLKGDVTYHLYGPNYEGEERGKHTVYEGQYPPDELPGRLTCGFGLVWDGAALDGCTGPMGEYLKYNNPHKTSLYLASGLPVIIWRKAAMAELVEKKNVGIAVDSLHEISERIGTLGEEAYAQMKKNAEALGEALRTGQMLRRAVDLLGEVEG